MTILGLAVVGLLSLAAGLLVAVSWLLRPLYRHRPAALIATLGASLIGVFALYYGALFVFDAAFGP